MKRTKEKIVIREFFRNLFNQKNYLDKKEAIIEEDPQKIIRKAKKFYP